MALSGSYTQKPGAIPAYFDAMLDAQPPERFSIKFLENLGFASTNDRLFIGILKDLGFLNADGAPQQRYYDFMDKSESRNVLAAAIKDSYSDLFAVNTKANEATTKDISNKLRTLFAGKKTNQVIDRISKTFSALREYADFTKTVASSEKEKKADEVHNKVGEEKRQKTDPTKQPLGNSVSLESLQYHINIVLPETRDTAVYDAIFRSLREHLGTRHE